MEQSDKYMFEWCKDCAYLKGCYYQHGYFQGPNFLDPDCANGPAKE